MKPSSDRQPDPRRPVFVGGAEALRAVQNKMLSTASLLVPADQRSEWRREWQGELWHVRHSLCEAGALSWPAQREITAFCLGSLQDAFCLRREFRRHQPPMPRISGAAGQCLLSLCTLLAVAIVIARLLPGVQAERDPSRFQVSPGLILIQTSPSPDESAPSISADLYHNWQGIHQRYFDDFAFYRTVREFASIASRRATVAGVPTVGSSSAGWSWRVAHSTLNLFSLLGYELPFDVSGAGDLPAAILSHESWRRDFGADPRVPGRIIRIGTRLARIAGVMPYGFWRLPGNPDAWMLESESQLLGAAPLSARGFLIAHLSWRGQAAMQGESVSISVRGAFDSDFPDLYAVSFDNRFRGPSGLFLFALILALLALPAVTSVTLGESNYSSHRPSRTRTAIRWAFLAAKFVFVVAIAYFASLDLAYWNAATYSPVAECAQLAWAFVICLFGFRWALSDQRQRCPVCLRRVTHPARVGLASRTFLGWNGTEMMCVGGHTLLHVPSLPTSWFSGQRWLYLDTSWEFLFADSSGAF